MKRNLLRIILCRIAAVIISPYFLAKRFFKSQSRFIKAVNLANRLRQATGCHYYVLLSRGRYIVKPKRQIRAMLKCRGKYFNRGVTIRDIEKIALYKTK